MKVQLILIALISLLIGYLLLGKNLEAQWSYIDDHEIPYYLGGKDRMGPSEFNAALQKTEFYKFGKGARFRPAYSILRITETLLWGNNPFLWYLARLAMFVFSFSLAWILLTRFVGVVLGFLTLMFTLTFTYWADIWTRAGPGEIYCVPAFVVFLWVFANLLEQKRGTTLNWSLLFISTMIMVGSKETFVFIVIFILFLDAYLVVKKRMSRVGAVASGLALGFVGYVVSGVGVYIYKTGVDFYMNNAGAFSRLTVAVNRIMHLSQKLYPYDAVALVIFVLLVVWFASFVMKLRSPTKKLIIFDLYKTGWILSGITLTVISQIYLYNGTWPSHSRYDFPGMLAIPAMLITVYCFLISIFRLLKWKYAARWSGYVFGALLVSLIIHAGFEPLVRAGEANVTQTNEFAIRLDTIKKDLAENPAMPILYESCSTGDYEFVTSVNRFLSNELKGHPMYLKFTPETNNISSGLDTFLSGTMRERSIYGDTIFRPLSQLPQTSDCYSVNFSCPMPQCSNTIFMVRPWCISPTNPNYSSGYRTILNSSCRL